MSTCAHVACSQSSKAHTLSEGAGSVGDCSAFFEAVSQTSDFSPFTTTGSCRESSRAALATGWGWGWRGLSLESQLPHPLCCPCAPLLWSPCIFSPSVGCSWSCCCVEALLGSGRPGTLHAVPSTCWVCPGCRDSTDHPSSLQGDPAAEEAAAQERHPASGCAVQRGEAEDISCRGWGAGHVPTGGWAYWQSAWPSPLLLSCDSQRPGLGAWGPAEGSISDLLDAELLGFSQRGVAGGPRPDPGSHPFSLPPHPPTIPAFSSPGPLGLYPSLPLGARLKLLLGMEQPGAFMLGCVA